MDPEDLRDLLREYQHRCASVIRASHGHVAQFLGDGVMAYFGYPTADDRTAIGAVRAGLAIVASVAEPGRPSRSSAASVISVSSLLSMFIVARACFVLSGSLSEGRT